MGANITHLLVDSYGLLLDLTFGNLFIRRLSCIGLVILFDISVESLLKGNAQHIIKEL